MSRVAVLITGMIVIFTLVSAVMLAILRAPHKQIDYLVAGVVATLACMLVLFLVLIRTSMKTANPFYRKRKS